MRLEGSSVAFVCPSRFSLGETYNALRVASQLSMDLGVSATMVVSREHEWYAAQSGLPVLSLPHRRVDNRVWLKTTLEAVGPDLIVIADHSNLALERTSLDFEALRSPGIPLLALDSLQFAPGPRKVEYAIARMPGAERLRRWLPLELEIPALPSDVPVVTPSPVASPKGALAPFALYETLPSITSSPSKVREKWGLPRSATVVVSAQSNWASTAFDQLSLGSAGAGRYDDFRTRRLVRALDATGRRTTLVGVSGKDVSSGQAGRTELRRVPRLTSQSFTNLLAAADLYVTDNLISGAMAQAALLGTPVLALTNPAPYSPLADDPLDAELTRSFPGFGFPYVVNPFGWHRELGDVLRDNPYLSAVPQAPVYATEDVSGAINRQLGEPDVAPTHALHAMLTRLDGAASTFTRAVAPL